MSLLQQQNFLARIFTDEDLRHSFWENPQIIGTENGLDEAAIAQLKEIVAADLNFFADSLFRKRLHEVERLLPLTKRALGENFKLLFREFSQTFQPATVKKYLEDAVAFCKHLQQSQTSMVKDAARFELTKHEFFSRQKLISVCFLRHDAFGGENRLRLAVWYRLSQKTYHFYL